MPQPKFADYFVEAAYLPFEFAIHIHQDAPPPGTELDSRTLRLRAHEYQHGLDHAGTPWGFELSREILEAVGSLQEGATEHDLWRLIRLHDTVRRLSHDHYYRTSGPAARSAPKARWAWEFTVGHEFAADGRVDHYRPIIFTRFFDAATNGVIQRQPLTPAALLEARAIFVELQLAMASPNRDEEVQEFVRRAYDPGIAEYSAAAHTVSTTLQLDIVHSYEVASVAAWYALMLPRFHQHNLTRSPWTETLGEQRLTALARNRDPGFVFATLVRSGARYAGDARAWLEAATELAGLPSVEQALRDGREAIARSPQLETAWGKMEFECLRQTTLNNFAQTEAQFGLLSARGGPGELALLHLADCHFANGVVQLHGQRVLPFTDPKELREMGTFLQEKIDWFLTACR